MPTPKKPKTTPVAIRLTEAERADLVTRAGRRSLGDYIREKLFGQSARQTKTPSPGSSARDLAHVLAQLGQSNLGPSLREMAKAASMGALPLTPENEEAIRQACEATIAMRNDLMRALGLKDGSAP